MLSTVQPLTLPPVMCTTASTVTLKISVDYVLQDGTLPMGFAKQTYSVVMTTVSSVQTQVTAFHV